MAIGVIPSVIGCEPYSSRLHETSSVVQRCEARPAKGSPPKPVASLATVGVELSTSETGTAQASVPSPLHGNVYLHSALDLWFETEVKPRCGEDRRRSLITFDFLGPSRGLRSIVSHEITSRLGKGRPPVSGALRSDAARKPAHGACSISPNATEPDEPRDAGSSPLEEDIRELDKEGDQAQ